MDGISSASAVISLAAQLIVTIRDVINFLQEIQDSPEELRCTIGYLDQLRDNLEGAKRLVEERIACVDLPSSVVSIGKALEFCHSKIAPVELFVNRFKGALDSRSFFRKKWASLQYVVKKGEIKRLQNQLRDAIRNLQTALMIDVGWIG